MVKIKFKSNYRILNKKISSLRSRMEGINPQELADQAATHFQQELISALQEQGRGGEPPPLSGATEKIYTVDGEPDGSGIVNHIHRSLEKKGKWWIGSVTIPPGNPSLVAQVQNSGATIPVTDKMRGFLSSRGIHLRSTTNYIYIPGRRFWQKAKSSTKRFVKKRLKKNVLH